MVLDIGNVNPMTFEFDVQLTESTVLGQLMSPSSFDDMTSINLDLAETKIAPPAVAESFESGCWKPSSIRSSPPYRSLR